ncbi:hypothetical protein [Embleya sp. NBC_00896]|uniref:hypothetical protein n=1 Tax=Embleya sp. NBC_00896 TaxID=2975961 RepID=UPI002F91809B|nr:hypothetical protein OG928_45665 [Embleya sp. NBC_00896]
MVRKRAQAAVLGALALAATVAVGACGSDGNTPHRAPANTTTMAGPTAPGPTDGWGPGMWGGMMGPGMMGGAWNSWAPGMMGPGMTGNWWLPGDGVRVQSLDQARGRATVFADRLGLRVGEVMQFSRNFYAELHAADGRPATEVLVNPSDGAVQIEYGPAMMWNTAYGMHFGSQDQARVSPDQAREIADRWLRDHGNTHTAGDPEPYPGYYTLHTMQAGSITGMLSVNATTGQVWEHTWHGTYIATSPH